MLNSGISEEELMGLSRPGMNIQTACHHNNMYITHPDDDVFVDGFFATNNSRTDSSFRANKNCNAVINRQIGYADDFSSIGETFIIKNWLNCIS